MSTATTLAAYGAALVVVFGTAVGVGNAVGPVGATAEPAHSTGSHDPSTTSGAHGDAGHDDSGHDGSGHSGSGHSGSGHDKTGHDDSGHDR